MSEDMARKSPDISVIIPSKDEAENLRLLLPDLAFALRGLGVEWEILVVDSTTGDNTREVAVSVPGARYLVEQASGYGGALLEGFRLSKGTYLITMDADLSHPADFIQTLWAARGQGDVLIASRYIAGGKADQPMFRLLLSRVLNWVFRKVLGTEIRDLSSGYRLYKREVLQDIQPTFLNFAVLVEIVLWAQGMGFRVVEIPFHYQPRRHGQSHARIIRFGIDYLRLLLMMRRLHRKK